MTPTKRTGVTHQGSHLCISMKKIIAVTVAVSVVWMLFVWYGSHSNSRWLFSKPYQLHLSQQAGDTQYDKSQDNITQDRKTHENQQVQELRKPIGKLLQDNNPRETQRHSYSNSPDNIGIARGVMPNTSTSIVQKAAARPKENCINKTPNTMSPVLDNVLEWTKSAASNFNTDRVAMPEVFISVKSTASHHMHRLSVTTTTWMQTAVPEQIHIVTDTAEDRWTDMAKSFGINVKVVTSCPVSHSHKGLCCKSGAEYDQYYTAIEQGEKYRWFCHFDDDTYVNIPALVRHLQKFNPEKEKLYMGHFPLQWKNKKLTVSEQKLQKYYPDHKNDNTFRYATGASYCISTSLMAELELILRGMNMVECCERLQIPDDLTVGAAVECILGYKLMEVPEMLSHGAKRMALVGDDKLKEMISVGFNCERRVNITAAVFTPNEDPSGFLSYHCLLFPDTPWCVLE